MLATAGAGHIVDNLNERKEHEVVLDPDKLLDLKVEQVELECDAVYICPTL